MEESKAVSTRFVIALCFIVSVLEGYDLQVISSAGPHLKRIMNLSPDQVGLFFGASLVGLAIGAVIGGRLADRFGRKTVLLWSVFTLGLFTFATAFAPDYNTLLTMRVLAGIGLGGAMPTLIALIAEVCGGKGTTSAVTTMICGQPLGGIMSAVAGKTIGEAYGWQSLFILGGVLTILILPVLMRYLPETKPSVAMSTGVQRMTTSEALFGGGRTLSTVMLWLVFVLTLALLSALLAWAPLLVIGKGLPRPIGLNAVIAINIGGIIGGMLVSRAIDKMGPRMPMLGLYAVLAIGLYLFAHTGTPGLLMVTAVLVGIGVLGAQFCLYGIAPQIYPPAGRGSAVGIAVAVGRIGSIGGPIILGWLMSGGASEDRVVLIMVPVALLSALAIYALTNATPQLKGAEGAGSN